MKNKILLLIGLILTIIGLIVYHIPYVTYIFVLGMFIEFLALIFLLIYYIMKFRKCQTLNKKELLYLLFCPTFFNTLIIMGGWLINPYFYAFIAFMIANIVIMIICLIKPKDERIINGKMYAIGTLISGASVIVVNYLMVKLYYFLWGSVNPIITTIVTTIILYIPFVLSLIYEITLLLVFRFAVNQNKEQ